MAQKKVTQPPIDYEALSSELETIVSSLQQADGDVDVAMDHYERGLEIIKLLETHLRSAETKISTLKAQFDR